MIEFGRFAAERRKRNGLGKPETFNFLGFTFVCGKTRAGKFQLRRKSRRDRMQAKLRMIKDELRLRMHQPIPEQGQWLRRVVRGYFNYYAVPTNARALDVLRHHVTDLWRRTLRRRGQKDRTSWARMTTLADAWLPKPNILHPWPSVRFAVPHPGGSRMRESRTYGSGGGRAMKRASLPLLKRRAFISWLGGAAASSSGWSLDARAQQKMPTIGFLGVSTASSWTNWTAAFVGRLGELGWTDGRNVAIEYRWAAGIAERYPEIVAEFVRRKVDVIVTEASPYPQQSKQPRRSRSCSRLPRTRLEAAGHEPGAARRQRHRPFGSVERYGLQANRNSTRNHSRPPPDRDNRQCRHGGSVEEMREVQAVAGRLGLEVDKLKFAAPRILRLPSSNSRPGRRHCTCAPTHWPTPTAFASISWRWVPDCQRCTACGNTSIRQV